MRYCLTKDSSKVEPSGPKTDRLTIPIKVMTHNEFSALPDDKQAEYVGKELRGELKLILAWAI